MARSLNKSRILISKIVGIVTALCIFFATSFIEDEGFIHEAFDMLGLLMISFCALGRLYTTAYLGGQKNESLMVSGPFSIVRNPLYFFSLIGFTGIAFMTNHIVLIVLVPCIFLVLYLQLIQREEDFLKSKFGDEYVEYTQSVPKLWPNISLYTAPDTITVDTRTFKNGAYDAIWWFAAYPLVEFAEFIRELNLIPEIVYIP